MSMERPVRARPALASWLAMLAAVAALAACTNAETSRAINQRSAEAEKQLIDARQPQSDAKHYDPLVVSDKVWSGDVAFRMHRGMPLPSRFETSDGIALVSSKPMSIGDIATAITTQTGIPVRVGDMSNAARGPGPGMGIAAVRASSSQEDMPVSYQGPLSGLMEKIAGYFDIDWAYDGTAIDILRMETRVFMIEALPQSVTMQDSSTGSSSTSSNSSGGSGGSGGSSGGGSSGGGSSGGGSSGSGSSGGSSVSSSGSLIQNVAYIGAIKYWEELKETLTAMLGGTGTIVTAPSSGEVTVTTTPEIMRTVSSYLEKENKRISRQIAINVEVFSIDLSQGEDFGTNFSALLKKLGSVGNFTYTGPAAPTSAGALTGLSSLSVTIFNPNNIHYGSPVQDVISAMSSLGNVTQVAQFPMITLNNRPVSRFVGTSTNYVPEIQSNTVSTTATSTSETVTTATINSGFTVQLTPRLLDDGRIMMQYSLSIAGTPTFQYFNSCTGVATPSSSSTCPSVQLPTQQARTFIQQSVLRSGSTLMIGGVDEHDVSQNAQGVGSPFNFMLGGGTSNANDHTMVFISITPQVLEDSPPQGQGL